MYEEERSIIIVLPSSRSSKNIWNGTTERRYVTSLLVEASRMRRTKRVGCSWKSRPANRPMIKFRPEQPEFWKDILQGHYRMLIMKDHFSKFFHLIRFVDENKTLLAPVTNTFSWFFKKNKFAKRFFFQDLHCWELQRILRQWCLLLRCTR